MLSLKKQKKNLGNQSGDNSRLERWEKMEEVQMGKFSYKKVRKHVSQMNGEEKKRLRNMFSKVGNWEILDHVNNRIVQKGYKITVDDFIDVMRNGEIVEYEQKLYTESKKISHLVVIRSIRNRDGVRDRPHLVFDITDGKIVTMWINSYDDNHDTLDMGIYSKGLKVGENYWLD